MSSVQADVLAVARRLAMAAGVPPPQHLEPLAGGRNNRVFRVDTGAEPVVLKCYRVDARDRRDRLGTEWRFVDYVWSRGVRAVPRPLASDATVGAALYSFVPGRKLMTGEVGLAAVCTAADFVCAINAPPRTPGALEPASEACFSLADHLATMHRRVNRLTTLDPEAPHRDDAATLVKGVLEPAWARVETAIIEAARRDGIALDAVLPEEEIVTSPSDFGFHNALGHEGGSLTFIDFEYAGRDDPAKLACDFFCCPEVPVPLEHWAQFLRAMRDGIGLPEGFLSRADMLLDAYRLKWACIVLNDFLPVDASRRAFALPGERAARCRDQLDKAAAKLAEIGRR